MNHQHHLKSDPKFGRFSRFSRGGGALGSARGGDDGGGALGQRWATVVRPSGHGRKAFGATVVRPSGPRSQGLRGLRGFVRLNFRVTIPGVSGVSNPGLLVWLKALDIGGTCETC